MKRNPFSRKTRPTDPAQTGNLVAGQLPLPGSGMDDAQPSTEEQAVAPVPPLAARERMAPPPGRQRDRSPAGAPEQAAAEPARTEDQTHRADGESARPHPDADTASRGRVTAEDFLGEGFAALDRPRLAAEHKNSEVLKPSAQRKRGSQPRSETLTVRLTPDELVLLGRAAVERGPNLSGFIADAAVAVAGNRISALLPHERAVRVIGEEIGSALHDFGKAANNLNQLVRQGHMGIAPVEPERVEATLSRLDRAIEAAHLATLQLNQPSGER